MISATHSDLEISNIEDLRQLLNCSSTSASHTQQLSKLHQDTHPRFEPTNHQQIYLSDPELTYWLRYVPLSLSHVHIQSNLSYYGKIRNIQEVDKLPPIQREILITFNNNAKISLLDNIWIVNIQGHNISIAKAHLTNSQLDY